MHLFSCLPLGVNAGPPFFLDCSGSLSIYQCFQQDHIALKHQLRDFTHSHVTEAAVFHFHPLLSDSPGTCYLMTRRSSSQVDGMQFIPLERSFAKFVPFQGVPHQPNSSESVPLFPCNKSCVQGSYISASILIICSEQTLGIMRL